MNRKQRLKVLVVAASCHPDKGSEPGVGWGWVEALSAWHHLTVIVGEREGNRSAIEGRLAANPRLAENIQFHFLPRDEWTPACNWFPPLYYHRHRLWHTRAFELAQRLSRERHFDLCHHLTMIGFREPGYLWRLGLPFVWGPVGGTANVPLRFARELGTAGFCYHAAKTSVNELQLRLSRRVARALAHARLFITATSDTREKIRRVLGYDSVVINETGAYVTEAMSSGGTQRGHGDPLRIGWSGVHIAPKALPILLRALALLPRECAWELEVLGHGPETKRWWRLSRSLGIDGHCRWRGWLTRPEALEIMRGCHVFAFPSLKEASATVIMEALSLGLPVVCFNHCGMADIVTADCGIKVPITSPRAAYRAFADALLILWQNEGLRRSMSHEALSRSRTFTYAAKAEVVGELYRRLVATGG